MDTIHTIKKVKIYKSQIWVDKTLRMEKAPALPTENFLKEIYHDLHLNYSKFFKMDKLSKLAFLGAEILFSDLSLTENEKENKLMMFFFNQHSSIDTDIRFEQSTLPPDIPSPAAFVYTLPNIMMAEISIRHKIHGPQYLLLSPLPNVDETLFEALFCSKLYPYALVGYVDLKGEDYMLELSLQKYIS